MKERLIRKYGEATSIPVMIWNDSGVALKGDAVFAAGDITVSKDFGATTPIGTLPSDVGEYFQLDLSATELQAQTTVIHFRDQTSPVEWLEDYLIIDTCGHPNAKFGFDFTSLTPDTNVQKIYNNELAASGLSTSARLIFSGVVDDTGFAPTTTQFQATGPFSSVDDQYKNRLVLFLDAPLKGEARVIAGYVGANKRFTVDALTSAPADGASFVII